MEGKVYSCHWQKTKSLYRLWLERNPAVLVTDTDFERCADLLCEKIAEQFGDGEAVLDFSPPPPASGNLKDWTTPPILLLGYNESTEAANEQSTLYVNGICKQCGLGLGRRSGEKLLLVKNLKGDIAAVAGLAPRRLLISSEFMALLRDEELEGVELREVEFLKSSKEKYFEVIGGRAIPQVSFKGAKLNPVTSKVCSLCKSLQIDPAHPNFYSVAFVPRQDVMDLGARRVFLIRSPDGGYDICVKGEDWMHLKGKAGTKGIVTSPIGLVDPDKVVLNPFAND